MEDIKENKYDEDTIIYYKLMIKEKNIQKQLKNYKNYKNILKYEGEYLNVLRNGIGKEYDINGKLIFEGEYLIGKIKKKKK